MKRLAVAVLAALLTFLGAAPADADKEYVDLYVRVSLDKNAYLATDVVRMRVEIINGGTATATGVVVRSSGDLTVESTSWGALEASGPGMTLEPGRGTSVVVTAPPNDTGAGMTQHVEVVSAEPDADPANNQAAVESFVTAELVDLALTVYGDADRDGVVDKGEAMGGVAVTLIGGLAYQQIKVRTGATGTVRLPGIPGGLYHSTANLPAGWYLDPEQRLRLRPGQNDLAVRALHIDMSKLVATVSLDRDTYAVMDEVRERVTLTNKGSSDITGLYARCGDLSGFGQENQLPAEGWADLDPATGGGATVRAGETRTWEFKGVVPPRAWDYGYVMLKCEFVVPGMLNGPYAEAQAAVPGGQGSFVGIVTDVDKKPVPDLKLLMINKRTGAVTSRAVTGTDGRFEFPEMPADLYEFRPVGPWRWELPAYLVQILAGERRELMPFVLFPGPVQTDPDERRPVPAAPAAPAPVVPQASPVPRLANTGPEEVPELTAFGFLLVVAGALMVRARRRV